MKFVILLPWVVGRLKALPKQGIYLDEIASDYANGRTMPATNYISLIKRANGVNAGFLHMFCVQLLSQ